MRTALNLSHLCSREASRHCFQSKTLNSQQRVPLTSDNKPPLPYAIDDEESIPLIDVRNESRQMSYTSNSPVNFFFYNNNKIRYKYVEKVVYEYLLVSNYHII